MEKANALYFKPIFQNIQSKYRSINCSIYTRVVSSNARGIKSQLIEFLSEASAKRKKIVNSDINGGINCYKPE